MAKEKKATNKKPLSGKKKMLKTVTDQLDHSLTSLKKELGEKKFKKRIKKAAKKLVAGIKKSSPKKASGKAKKAVLLKPKSTKPSLKKSE